jgi:tetratricopeptide (TPR) repeat protein
MTLTKRATVLLGVLLLLVIAFVGHTIWQSTASPRLAPVLAAAPPLQGTTAIQEASAARDDKGLWRLRVTYFYTGEPANAAMTAYLVPASNPAAAGDPKPVSFAVRAAGRGTQDVELEIHRVGDPRPMTTTQVLIELRAGNELLSRKTIEQRIEWPDQSNWLKDRNLATQTSAAILATAVSSVDIGSRASLDEARDLLERLVKRDPRFDPAYVELARIAMKSNWGPQGLRQAESLLMSALEIRPDSTNAQILQGYVYTHQGRFKQAEAMFEQAATAQTSNLWLWANWGEMLVKQGRTREGIAKYREAITRQRTHDTYDRARLDAYKKLIGLLSEANDLDAVENLHRQRTEEFGLGTCLAVEYARFLLQRRGNSTEAIARAQRANDEQCKGDEAREVLGLAYYTAWASAERAHQDDLLRQARVYLPTGPRLIFQLAVSPSTAPALQRLMAIGESIDQVDNRRFNALALALEDSDLAAARRLLRLGAKTLAPVGPMEMPVALLPVVKEDLDAIRLMQQHGVDYSRLRYQGMTALDHARRVGNKKLIDVLDRQARSL